MSPHPNCIFRALRPEHRVIALVADMHKSMRTSWNALTKSLGEDLENLPRLIDTQREMMGFLVKHMEWIFVPGVKSDAHQLKFAVEKRIATTGREDQRPIIFICDEWTLKKLVTSRKSHTSGTLLFGKDVAVAHSGLQRKTIDNVLSDFKQGTTQILFTTPHFIYGAVWDFLPKLFVVHLPARYDEWVSVLQWCVRFPLLGDDDDDADEHRYACLCDRMCVRPHDKRSPHALGPSIQILHRAEENETYKHHKRLLERYV